jgi:hypothetical protein
MVVDGQGILRVLLHIVCTASKARGKNKAFSKLIRVHISICCHCIMQALIELHPKLLLIESMIVEVVLFSNSPYLIDILLKELTSKEEMIGLNVWRARKEVKVIELCQTHIFVLGLSLLIFHLLIRDEVMPTKLVSRMEQDIMQERIEGINIFDALKISYITM